MYKWRFYSVLIILLSVFLYAGEGMSDTSIYYPRLPGAWITHFKFSKTSGSKVVSCSGSSEAVCQGSSAPSQVRLFCNPSTDSYNLANSSCTPPVDPAASYNPSSSCCYPDKIPLGSCDPQADPALDSGSQPNYLKTCSSQGITRYVETGNGASTTQFAVNVTFDPKQPSPYCMKGLYCNTPDASQQNSTTCSGTSPHGAYTNLAKQTVCPGRAVIGDATLPICNTNVAANQSADTCNEALCPIDLVYDKCSTGVTSDMKCNTTDVSNQDLSHCSLSCTGSNCFSPTRFQDATTCSTSCPASGACFSAIRPIIATNPNHCYPLQQVQVESVQGTQVSYQTINISSNVDASGYFLSYNNLNQFDIANAYQDIFTAPGNTLRDTSNASVPGNLTVYFLATSQRVPTFGPVKGALYDTVTINGVPTQRPVYTYCQAGIGNNVCRANDPARLSPPDFTTPSKQDPNNLLYTYYSSLSPSQWSFPDQHSCYTICPVSDCSTWPYESSIPYMYPNTYQNNTPIPINVANVTAAYNANQIYYFSDGEPVPASSYNYTLPNPYNPNDPYPVPGTGCINGSSPMTNGMTAITTPVPVNVQVVYSALQIPGDPPVNVSGSTLIGDDGATCTIGTKEYYVAGQYVRDANCNRIKDIYSPTCYNQASSSCNAYVTGGGLYYNYDGSEVKDSHPVIAVNGTTTISDSGSLYNDVFNSNSDAEKLAILNLAAQSKDVIAGQTVVIQPSARITFELTYTNNQACVFAFDSHPYKWSVEGTYPKTLSDVYGVIDGSGVDPNNQPDISNGITSFSVASSNNCVYAPPPSINKSILTWQDAISPVCTNYDTSASQFRDSTGKSRSFTGVVVQCIQDSMLNILYPAGAGYSSTSTTTTLFSSMQSSLSRLIMLVLVLYTIMFGYKLMIGKKVPKKEEWMWLVLKFSFVFYFAMGSGMITLLPYMVTVSQRLAVLVMDAGLGVVTSQASSQCQSQSSSVTQAYNTAQSTYAVNSQAASIAVNNLNNYQNNIATYQQYTNDRFTILLPYLTTMNSANAALAAAQSELAALQNAFNTDIGTVEQQYSNAYGRVVYSPDPSVAATNADNSSSLSNGDATFKVPNFCTSFTIRTQGGGAAGLYTPSYATINGIPLNGQSPYAISVANANKNYNAGSNQTYQIPPFCKTINVQLWGAGASGRMTNGPCGGRYDVAGGAGGYASVSNHNVTVGNSYAINVGSGASSMGSNGGQSDFGGNLIIAYGGQAGNATGNAPSTSGQLSDGNGFYAPGGSAGGSWNPSIVQGGSGLDSCGTNEPGTAAASGSAEPASECPHNSSNWGTYQAPMGGGGCVADDNPTSGSWGKGGDGYASVSCNMDYSSQNSTNLVSGQPSGSAVTDNTGNLNNVSGTITGSYSGGAGGYISGTLNLKPNSGGATFPVHVGNGGSGGGASGSVSWFNDSTTMYANGGGTDSNGNPTSNTTGGNTGGNYTINSTSAGYNYVSGGISIFAQQVGNVGYDATGAAAGGNNPVAIPASLGQPASSCWQSSVGSPAINGGGGCASFEFGTAGSGAAGSVEIDCNFTWDANTKLKSTNPDYTDANKILLILNRSSGDIQAKEAQVNSLQTAVNTATNDYNAYLDIYCQMANQLLNYSYAVNDPSHPYTTIENTPLIPPASTPTMASLCAGKLNIGCSGSMCNLYTTASAANAAAAGSQTALTTAQTNLYGSCQLNASQVTNTGYAYCDFRSYPICTSVGQMGCYPKGKEYMQLWDMIDCRFTKYLGIGANDKLRDAPQVILVAVLAPLNAAYGIPIFFFVLIFTAIIIMIIVRVVHIYIMAFIGLVLLVYISPLTIPSILFEFTKGIYANWLQQLRLFLLQPVLLFAFLSFMFVAVDTVMYGNNHIFDGNNNVAATPATTPLSPATTLSQCTDASAVGCIMQTLTVEMNPWPTKTFYFFKMWSMDFGQDGGKALFIGYVKLMLIIFVVYSVLATVERITATLIQGMGIGSGAGVAQQSAAPIAGPAKIFGGMASGVGVAKDTAYKTGHAAWNAKSTASALKRSVLNSTPANIARATGRAGSAVSNKVNDIRAGRAARSHLQGQNSVKGTDKPKTPDNK